MSRGLLSEQVDQSFAGMRFEDWHRVQADRHSLEDILRRYRAILYRTGMLLKL